MTWKEGKFYYLHILKWNLFTQLICQRKWKKDRDCHKAKKTNELYATDGSEFIYTYNCDNDRELKFINKKEISSEEGRKVMNLYMLMVISMRIFIQQRWL